MPSLTSYSPYETLVFFQNVARRGADASAFKDISTVLNQNQLIRESKSYDSDRLSPDALQHLYEKLIPAQNEAAAKTSKAVNGDTSSSASNPRKRKLSASPPPSSHEQQKDEQNLVQFVVDHLYARYKEEVVKEIRQEERAYQKLQEEVNELERISKEEEHAKTKTLTNDVRGSEQEPRDSAARATPVLDARRADLPGAQLQAGLESSQQPDHKSGAGQHSNRTSPQRKTKSPSISQALPERVEPSRVPTPGSNASSHTLPQERPVLPSQASTQTVQTQAGPLLSKTPSMPSPQRVNHVPVPQPPGYAPSVPSPRGTPSTPQHMPPPGEHSLLKRTNSQGRGSPTPYQTQSPYPVYPPYPRAPYGWQQPIPPQQYAHYPPYPPHYYPQPQHHGQHPHAMQTPHQMQYPPYPSTAPLPYHTPQPWRGHPNQAVPGYPLSASVTPVLGYGPRNLVSRSNTSTPWKRQDTGKLARPSSPTRLDRDVSPLSDRGSPIQQHKALKSTHQAVTKAQKQEEDSLNHPHRPGRAAVTPSARTASRSSSVSPPASQGLTDGQDRSGREEGGQKIKLEPASTPAPLSSEADLLQRSSSRRGRPRADTASSKLESGRGNLSVKRKRGSAGTVSPSPSLHTMTTTTNNLLSLVHAHGAGVVTIDPSLVVVSRSFAKTSQLLLNDIISHKLAGIFAKPLSERDAPGHKELIRRPQDLKSIKAAINKGCRMAVATIEDLEAQGVAAVTASAPLPTSNSTSAPVSNGTDIPRVTGVGSLGRGFYVVSKTDELVPPKGIVNSSQLEMELVRMFANAIMFNPLPRCKSGFPESLRLLKHGGGQSALTSDERSAGASPSPSEEGHGSDVEGGIISDAREMFDDVVRIVAKWRELEEERMGGPNAPSSSAVAVTSSSTLGSGLAVGDAALATRQPSVSGSSALGHDDDIDREATPSASATGPPSVRKRRKVGDH